MANLKNWFADNNKIDEKIVLGTGLFILFSIITLACVFHQTACSKHITEVIIYVVASLLASCFGLASIEKVFSIMKGKGYDDKK